MTVGVRRHHDRTACHQQQVDEVRHRQRRLGAQRSGDEQAERGEGRSAEQGARRARRAAQAGVTAGDQPSRSAAVADDDELEGLDDEERADLAGQQARARQR